MVKIYDTTLRDGMQGSGLSLSVSEKIQVVHLLDDLGVDIIEAGFPASNPKETAFFSRLQNESLKHSSIAAFGMTRRKNNKAAKDQALVLLGELNIDTITIVGKSWDLHLNQILGVSREENLEMIYDSISFLKDQNKEIIYDAEHFFDAFEYHPDYAIECLRTAYEAGACNITLCDTNGASLPDKIAHTTQVVKRVFKDFSIGIHTHNDSECAVANSLAAVNMGADLVQGTINGYGERCGNANLISIIGALELKMQSKLTNVDTKKLTYTSHLIDEIANRSPDPNRAYVGKHAFAHKGGMHSAGVIKDPSTFEHIDPHLVGNERHLLVSELSGKGVIGAKSNELQLDLTQEQIIQAANQLKELENKGYEFEAADGSLEILLHKAKGDYAPLFKLESFRVIVEKREDGETETEATIKLWIGEQRFVSTAEGNGPVNALDKALRKAILISYPSIAQIDLVNFKVRIIDENKGTAAITRVLLDASDSNNRWSTIGVSENIIEASWQALVDSIEAGMLGKKV